MFGLPQYGIFPHTRLATHLDGYRYTPVTHTNGLWHHHEKPITFTLVVNNFGVKYVKRAHDEHLILAPKDIYKVTNDWAGSLYVGITLN